MLPLGVLSDCAGGSRPAAQTKLESSHNVTTASCCFVPLLFVFHKLEEFVGGGTTYQPVNATQGRLLESQYWTERSGLAQKFTESELKGAASNSFEELNRFLVAEGYSIQLTPSAPGDFGAVAFQDVSVRWREPGIERPIRLGGARYPGFVLKGSAVRIGRSTAHGHPIAIVSTSNGDTVAMTRVDKTMSTWQLFDFYQALSDSGLSDDNSGYEGVHVPKVSLDKEVDLSWLLGLSFHGSSDGGRVSQAKQFIKLRMNQFGARAASAVAVTATLGMPRYLTMDGPFVLIMEREGVETPTFLGVIDTDSWKDPGDLNS